jgi:hypothetical protein
MKKYILPFILLSLMGYFVFALTGEKGKYSAGDCVKLAGGAQRPGEDSFIQVQGMDRLQYQIKQYYQLNDVWKVKKPSHYGKVHLDQTTYKIDCKDDVISSLKQEL